MLNLLINSYESYTKAQHLAEALNITWKGLVAIFIVISIVVAAVYVLNFIVDKFTKRKEK